MKFLDSFISVSLLFDIFCGRLEEAMKGCVSRYERKIIPFYAGQIWKRSVKSLYYAGFPDFFGDFHLYRGKAPLSGGTCRFDLCIFQAAL